MRFSKTILFILLFWNQTAAAQISISEIMYDVSGSDTGREWIEITNSGSVSVTVATSTWKFFEADTNHSLSLFQGSVVVPAGGFAVIADNPAKFLTDWPQFSGTIFDSAFSLGNTGELVAIKSDTGTVVDEFAYASSMGGAGDGNSLQKVNGAWTALTPTPGAVNRNGQSGFLEGQGTNSPVATTTPDATSFEENVSSPFDSGKTSWPVEPQIVSRIVGPVLGIAGADVVFRGEAVGLDKKPIKNARYLWNFGDGATKEGESVMHAYNFPAEYVVILEVASGHYEGASRVRIKIIPADIVVGSVAAGFDGKIELLNNSAQELDLSWWRIKSGNQFFTLPKNTKILPSGRLPLSAAVMGFAVDDSDVSLLYPNGVGAYKFEKVVEIPPANIPKDETFARVSETLAAPALPEISVPPDPRPVSKSLESPKALAQTASVALAVAQETDTDDPTNTSAGESSPLWLYGLGGVIMLGLGFALYPKTSAPPAVKNPADEYEIIE